MNGTFLNDGKVTDSDGNPLTFRGDVIERQLAHVQGGARTSYNKATYLAERTVMMQTRSVCYSPWEPDLAITREMYEAGIVVEVDTKRVWIQVLRLAGAGMGSHARRLKRQVGELAFTAYWWTILALKAIPAWLMVVILPRRRWRFHTAQLAANVFMTLVGTRPRVAQQRTLPEGGAIIIVNHSSYPDSLVLVASLPARPVFVAKEELAHELIAGNYRLRYGALVRF